MSAERPRVLVVFSSPVIGGAERSLVRMALASESTRCVDYHFATLGGDGALGTWLRNVADSPLVLDCFRRGSIDPRAVRALIVAIRRSRADVIYVVGVRAATLLRLLRPLLRGTRIVHGIRAVLTEGSREAAKFRWPERLLWRQTDVYVANSPAGAAALAVLSGVPRERLCVIPNGIEVGAPPANPLRSRPIEVAVVANIHPLKGHLPFLMVVREVARLVPNVLFRFIGRDEMDGVVARRAQELGLSANVSFEGFQSDVLPLLATARVFVLPSRDTEGAPTSVLEAAAAGLPTVAFRIGGLADLIDDGGDGLLAPVGDDTAMATAIVCLLKDPERAEAMGASGRAKVIANYSLEACAKRHADLWQELCTR